MSNALLIVSIIFVLYTYVGYPAILWLLSARKKPLRLAAPGLPSVTIVMAAHNEQACILKSLESVEKLDYPKDRVAVIVVSDGSCDRTDELVRSHADRGVELVRLDARRGLHAALATGFARARGDLLVRIDASSVLAPDSLSRLVSHFADPRVGSCAGHKVIVAANSTVARGDGLYWQYDAMLRELESRTGSSWVGVEGGFFAIRTSLARMDFGEDIAPDLAIGCRIYEQGYLNRYDSSAVVFEPASRSLVVEFRRKVRVIARGIRAFIAFRHLLNPIANPSFFFQTVSHKLCRWLVPFVLIASFVISATQAGSSEFARVVLLAQVTLTILAGVGALLDSRGIRLWIATVPLYFVVVNASCLVAWLLLPRRWAVWEPTAREGHVDVDPRA